MNVFLKHKYFRWFKKNSYTEYMDWWRIITVPFTGLHNDNIQVFIEEKDGRLILSDDRVTVNNMSGRNREEFDSILAAHNVKYRDNELILTTNSDEFPRNFHEFLHCLIKINAVLEAKV